MLERNIVTPKELKLIVKHCVTHNFPLLIKGKLGSGKTEISRQGAIEAGIKPERVIIETPHMKDIPDYTGFAMVYQELDKIRADFIPINTLEKMINATEPTVFIFDEIDKAKLTMNAIAQIIWGREISNRKIPDCVRFIATCNLPEEETGSSLIRPHLLDRFYSVVELRQNEKEWAEYMLCKWGQKALVMVAFIHFRPQYLLEGQNTDLAMSLKKTPTGRSIENYLKMFLSINAKANPEEKQAMDRLLAGAMGEEFHIEFQAFYQLYFSKLPTYEEIVNSPETAPIPTEDKQISMRYAIISMLAGRVDAQTCTAVSRYLLRQEWDAFASLRRVFLEQAKILHPNLLQTNMVVDLLSKT